MLWSVATISSSLPTKGGEIGSVSLETKAEGAAVIAVGLGILTAILMVPLRSYFVRMIQG